MRHIIFKESPTYRTAILVKSASFKEHELRRNYVAPLCAQGVKEEELIAFTLQYNEAGKAPVKFIKAYLEHLLAGLDSLGVTNLYVADSAYFKTLTKQTKAEPHHGYCLDCRIKGYEHMKVVLGINYQSLIFNPELQEKLDLGIKTLADTMKGTYVALGEGIIRSAHYPEGPQAIAEALQSLHQYPRLTCDIEAFSLRFNEAGIGTVAFAWNQNEGIAFACDYTDLEELNTPGNFGEQGVNTIVRKLLLEFFSTYKGEIIWHNCTYDMKALIYTLWMRNALDTVGLLEGLDVMTRAMHDTKIITYLATNSTAGNTLGLKPQAHEFAGNWAKDDIKDIRKIPLPELLKYNLVDALSTWYVHDKHWPTMVRDKQLDIYTNLFMPSQKTIIQMELTGMPLDPRKVQEVKEKLQTIQKKHRDALTNSTVIRALNLLIQQSAMEAANAKLKVKQHPLSKFSDVQFNPGSGPQLQRLLYEQMGLPVLDLTDTKQPATGAATIEKLIHHTTNPAYKEILEALIGFGKADKILSTFIPAFEKAIWKGESIVWLHGSFNLGGTVSGRLSSSDPNLQNIPAGSEYAKLIKECFVAPEGWLFCGADFNSLEDYISALTTKDPNKLAVYEKGFDGHSLRAAYYFRDQLPHIDLEDPISVNTIKKDHENLRQDSKAPTFLLTYGGTYHGMMNNLGWPLEKAKNIEANYHELYKVSDAYVQGRLEQASKDGYVEVAFGLRVRTPLLKQVVLGTDRVPYEASAEGRTAGNALGQSYGLLNNRAANEFMQKVWASEFRYDIKPVALIHDAIYLLVRDRSDVMEWVNRELIKSMQWQELPEIQHPVVKLGAALDIFWPHWGKPITLPNGANQEEIRDLCDSAKQSFLEAA